MTLTAESGRFEVTISLCSATKWRSTSPRPCHSYDRSAGLMVLASLARGPDAGCVDRCRGAYGFLSPGDRGTNDAPTTRASGARDATAHRAACLPAVFVEPGRHPASPAREESCAVKATMTISRVP